MPAPSFETTRLKLRPITSRDAVPLARLAGAREIADTMISVPHPLLPEQAEQWIAHLLEGFETGRAFPFGVELRSDESFIGAAELRDIDSEHLQAELSFWIGLPWWGQGYATEAVRAVMSFAFRELKLNRLYAHHMTRNPASGRVLLKLGMKQEGLLRQRVRKWGVFEDVVVCAILRADYGRSQGDAA